MRLWESAAVICLLSSSCFAATKSFTVAPDGSGDFKTVQEAIAAAPSQSGDHTVIHIKPGHYLGPFVVPRGKQNLALQGDDANGTVLAWDRNVRDPRPAGADGFNPGLKVDADDCYLSRLTIENTSGDHGQGLAAQVNGDRDLFADCRLVGWQDTLMVNNGRDYFQNCYVAGRVDFIYGSATAWFQDCEIHSRNGGHVTAGSTPQEHPYGFVFNNCKLTGDKTPWDPATTNPSNTSKPRMTPLADLGRPWRAHASVTYLNCEMGSHISPTGWNNWGQKTNEATARYSEYHSTGPGGASDKRYPWARQLADDQAKAITVESVLGGRDHWDPKVIAASLAQSPPTAAVSLPNESR